jgi:hypothetical protein
MAKKPMFESLLESDADLQEHLEKTAIYSTGGFMGKEHFWTTA